MVSSALDCLRRSLLWSWLRDWRYLHRHRDQRRFLAGFIHRGDLVFDVGANVGHYALVAASLGARVVAVEPQAALAVQLRRRFSGRRHVQVVQCALGAAAGRAALHEAPDQTEIASLRGDIDRRSRFAGVHAFSRIEAVDVTTLEALVERHGRPAFCKIDVEGFESAVLAGLHTPLAALSFEFNCEFKDDTRLCLERLDQLADYRYNFALGECRALAASRWLTADELNIELWSSSNPLLWGDIYARVMT